ncbi:hypothetical protein [Neptunicoccus cionae]|uniref:Uncharacterized protein n=1 Tax=Neptunicoccus cionae TaxID=2035344 RepID=A0A916R0U2_9RHOB|nr:hypothetical protein [Amylibacter cionae]GGA19356.1 hypothetical protein GCM10011498_20300 [Amylibacter cionae]
MPQTYRLKRMAGRWHVMAVNAATAAPETGWLSLGGCADPVTATRVYLALKRRKDHQ